VVKAEVAVLLRCGRRSRRRERATQATALFYRRWSAAAPVTRLAESQTGLPLGREEESESSLQEVVTMDPTFAAIMEKRKQQSGEDSGSSPHWDALGAPQAAVEKKEEQAAAADGRRENVEGKCKAPAAEVERQEEATKDAARVQAAAEQKTTQAAAEEEAEDQAQEKREAAAASAREEAAEAKRSTEEEENTEDEPAAQVKQGLLEPEEWEAEMPESAVATSECGNTCSGEQAVAAFGAQGIHVSTGSPTTTTPAALARPTFFEDPDVWMQVASFLCVSALGRLACTAARFRAVLAKCVTTSAAQASDAVLFVPSPTRL